VSDQDPIIGKDINPKLFGKLTGRRGNKTVEHYKVYIHVDSLTDLPDSECIYFLNEKLTPSWGTRSSIYRDYRYVQTCLAPDTEGGSVLGEAKLLLQEGTAFLLKGLASKVYNRRLVLP
jgi:hypothetical protein